MVCQTVLPLWTCLRCTSTLTRVSFALLRRAAPERTR